MYSLINHDLRVFCVGYMVLYSLTYSTDETTLTLFNTSSDQSSTYPMFLSVALLPRHLRRKPGNLINIALLPKFLKRHHPKASTTRSASLKRWLTWTSLRVVLKELLDCADAGPIPGYCYAGDFHLFGEDYTRRVFLTTFLYLGGAMLQPLCACGLACVCACKRVCA